MKPPSLQPVRVIETCLYADDLDAAERFYTDVLGLATYAKVPGRHVFFRSGDGMFLVFNASETAKAGLQGIPAHGASGPGHAAFATPESDLAEWQKRLRDGGVEIESDYTWPNGGRSLYFRDPAGNSIELTTPRTWNLEQ